MDFRPPFFALVAECFLLTLTALAAHAPQRIRLPIDDGDVASLKGNTKPMLALAQDQGEVSGTKMIPGMAIHFAMTSQQQQDLDQLLRQQQTRGSAQYHHFLTPEEYAARFGPNPDDVAKVTAWLAQQGFSNVQLARSRMFVSFEGIAAQAQTAFHTSLHNYQWNGEAHYANAADPQLPAALSGLVESIRGLNDFRMRPQGIRKLHSHFTSSISGSHFIAPGDFAAIYNVQPLYQAGLDGTGVKIAVVGQSDIQLSDVRDFRSAAGLSPNDPTIIVTGTDPGLQQSSDDESESDLDIEWAGAVARNATIVFITSTNVDNSISYAIDNNIAPILSISYGLCEASTGRAETATEASEYKQANAQGMTVFSATGDAGAADCDTTAPARRGLGVDVPSSLPYVTGIGGTTFNEGSGNYWNSTNDAFSGSALSYIPETAWNDSGTTGSLSATGGGASIYNAKPSWQTGTGVPNDGARDVPDVAFAASPGHDGYLVCSNGSCVNGFRNTDTTLDVIGGTSAGAPTFAGIVALLVQTLGPQGNINPDLYSLATTSTDAFHDVTTGNNNVTCRIGTANCASGAMGYSAGVGYDQVTGLGSVDAYHLVTEWTGLTARAASNSQGPLGFVPVTPCRVADTRNAAGAFGGPEMSAASTREFDVPNGACNIPSSAVAYALNVTAVPDAALTYLSIWPSGQVKPFVSTLNSDGRIKANSAIVPAGNNGGVNVYVTDAAHAIIDISGYFVPTASASGLQFFPLSPCRIADTRQSSASPYLTAGQSRDFPVTSSSCGVPSTAQAYSLNFTVIPHAPLLFVTAWPTGQTQPLASILNAPNGTTTANAAIIPAGTNGSVSTYSSADTDLVIDINGYFAPATTGGDYLYTLMPCRVIDTRNETNAQPSSGTSAIDVTNSGCQSPSTAQAYVLNATVVPTGPLTYLTLWPNGQATMPVVSTLNADPNTVTSNMAIVPTTNGSINAYAAGLTYLIVDISAYFAP